ncbi:MAG: hypothetical protein ACOCSF_07475 [Halanaeroarchaeum sp.]
MEGSEIEALLDSTREVFERRPKNVEDGLDVSSPAMLQLRKACRLLVAANALVERNGYYTVVVEASFGAIERTIQFHLLENEFLHADEFVDHRTVYERGYEAGLYDEAFREKLVGLWRNNRSRTYYREGVGSERRAETLLQLAEAIHDHVLQLDGRVHDCICSE